MTIKHAACPICKKVFLYIKGKKYCSKICRFKGYPRTPAICPICKKPFKKSSGKIYCSKKCFEKTLTYVNCQYCNKKIHIFPCKLNKNKMFFCNKSCESLFGWITKQCNFCNKTFKCRKSGSHPNKYCSNLCKSMARRHKIKKNCTICGKEVERTLSQINKSKHIFCSCSCTAKYYTKYKKYKRRSNQELYLYNLIKKDFPKLNIKTNDRQLLKCGYELDLWIPDIKLGVELNGPTHYLNIYGDLDKIQHRDSIKQKEMIENNYKLITININDRSDKVIKLLNDQYIQVIKPLLDKSK